MKIKETPLKNAYILTPKVFRDDRGYFFESFNEETTKHSILNNYKWVQENESKSTKGVLRGLHFQKGEYAQAKLVRVIVGEVFDVAVDLRKESPTYGKWHGEILTENNKKQFLVPRGFAHGFIVISEVAIFSYKCDNFYSPENDSGIIYNDTDLAINWPEIDTPFELSEKDKNLDSFNKAYKF
jgi:dTDP-4-dehydrorhamnose 3,5-epimerase